MYCLRLPDRPPDREIYLCRRLEYFHDYHIQSPSIEVSITPTVDFALCHPFLKSHALSRMEMACMDIR